MIIFLYESVQYLPERYGKPFMLIIWLISFKKSYKLPLKWVFYIFSANFGPYFNHRFGPNLIMPMLSRICGKPFPFNLFSFYLKENDIKPEKKFFIGIIKNCLNELFCMRNVFAWIYHGKSKLKSLEIVVFSLIVIILDMKKCDYGLQP